MNRYTYWNNKSGCREKIVDIIAETYVISDQAFEETTGRKRYEEGISVSIEWDIDYRKNEPRLPIWT